MADTQDYGWDEDAFVSLLDKLIGVAEHCQNKPPTFIPQESLVGNHIEETLKPYLEANGGPLKMERIEYAKGRNNVIVTYPGTTDKVISFVGSHMDVVVASPDAWSVDPFKMSRVGDKLYGRGTTDCLGHVALITQLLVHLGKTKPALKASVVAVFIANEENSDIPGVGVDELVKNGKIAHLKNGWMYWVDSADKHPCIGTGTAISWELKATGQLGHSGLPHKAMNAIILGYEAATEIANKFHEKFPAHEKEVEYGFACPSSMKITVLEHPPGAVNQIPGSCTVQGDIRVVPFYNSEDVVKAVQGFADEVAQNLLGLPGRGPKFGYQVGDNKAAIQFKFHDGIYNGIACNLNSPGFHAINEATKAILGESKPYSITGSLPLVFELQQEGFDLQVCGFGLTAVYHGIDEYCNISDMKQGYQIINKVIASLDAKC